MAATITLKNILPQLKETFSDIYFIESNSFAWSPRTRTIFHKKIYSHDDLAQLLHEVGHAQLRHSSYDSDIYLLDCERSAWEYAVHILAPKYNIQLSMDDAIIQNSLDSYRNWLHARSCCPNCGAIGLQQPNKTYRCLICGGRWKTNEARTCELRRYIKK